MPVVGLNAHCYRNTGTYGSPTWVECKSIQEVTLKADKDKADAPSRNYSGFKAYLSGMKDVGLGLKLTWDTTLGEFSAFQSAFFNNTTIDMLALDGVVTPSSGSQGLRAVMEVFKFDRTEPLSGALTSDVEVAPSATSANAPSWYTA